MTAVLAEIERQKQAAQIREWDAKEKALAARVIKTLQAEPGAIGDVAPLTSAESLKQQRFIEWCAAQGVRHCPAKPSTVATFILEHDRSHGRMLEVLAVITRMHDKHGLSNPCATALVRTVLETVIHDDPPRSWTKAEKELFSFLPADIRAAINRRERDREKYVGQARNEADQLRKKLNAENKTEGTPASNGAEPIKGIERTSEPSGASAL